MASDGVSSPTGRTPREMAHLPVNFAALVGVESTLLRSGSEVSSSENSRVDIPPTTVAVAATAAPPASGTQRLQQKYPGLFPPNPFTTNAVAGSGSVSARINEQGGETGGVHDRNDAQHIAMLAGIKSTQGHNVHLQHRVAFLEAQLIGQLGHIAKLQTRVRVLESELTSLKAKSGFGASHVPATSTASSSVAADLVGADPVAEGTTPPASPTSAPAPDLRRQVPGQLQESTPPNPSASGVVGNCPLWNLRPKAVDGPGEALTSFEQDESETVPPGTTTRAPRSLLSAQSPEPAPKSFLSALGDERVNPSASQPARTTAPADPRSVVVAEPTNNSRGCNSATTTAAAASVQSSHSLHDFWADNSHTNIANSPPANNTKDRSLRGELLAYGEEDDIGFIALKHLIACWKVSWDPGLLYAPRYMYASTRQHMFALRGCL